MTAWRLPPALLAVAIVTAIGSTLPVTAAAATPSWPLIGERSEQMTPLRLRRDAIKHAAAARSAIAAPRPAAVVPVISCADDGSPGSLRNVLTDAVSGDTVDLSALTCSRITLTGGVLTTEADDIHLLGPTTQRLTIDGNAQDRVLLHLATGTLTVENLDIANGRYEASGTDIGYAAGIGSAGNLTLVNSMVRDNLAIGVGAYGAGVVSDLLTMRNSTISGNTAFGDHPTNTTASYGGGAFVYEVDIADSSISANIAKGTHNAPLTHWEIGGGIFIAGGGRIERSTIADNLAYLYGGGLANEADITIINSTVSGNTARQATGGGLRIRRFTSLALHNSTITNNTAGTQGGGIFFADQAYESTLRSSIVAGNTSPIGADIGSGEALLIHGSNNLIQGRGALLTIPADTLSSDPLLLALANNGGPTATHALAANSPAINQGSNPLGLSSDQRGADFPRSANGGVDIGSWEGSAVAYVEPNAVPSLSAAVSALMASLIAGLGLLASRRRQRR